MYRQYIYIYNVHIFYLLSLSISIILLHHLPPTSISELIYLLKGLTPPSWCFSQISTYRATIDYSLC